MRPWRVFWSLHGSRLLSEEIYCCSGLLSVVMRWLMEVLVQKNPFRCVCCCTAVVVGRYLALMAAWSSDPLSAAQKSRSVCDDDRGAMVWLYQLFELTGHCDCNDIYVPKAVCFAEAVAWLLGPVDGWMVGRGQRRSTSTTSSHHRFCFCGG